MQAEDSLLEPADDEDNDEGDENQDESQHNSEGTEGIMLDQSSIVDLEHELENSLSDILAQSLGAQPVVPRATTSEAWAWPSLSPSIAAYISEGNHSSTSQSWPDWPSYLTV